MRHTLFTLVFLIASPLVAQKTDGLLRVDHYVRVHSAVPAISGQSTEIYVREVVRPGLALRNSAPGVVLFVHGAGTPAEVAFDVPYSDYSWMAWLAHAGFDVFSMDMTGYGRSTRPNPMNDPCNLSREQQAEFIPSLIGEPCTASYGQNMTTIASDWNDISAVVDHILALRHVDKLDMIGWSLGGPRAGGYTAHHPDKVRRLILLAPAYSRDRWGDQPATVPAKGITFNTQSHTDFMANWTRQVGCADQIEPAAADAVWSAMLQSDPVGATWGTGVRRAPLVTTWGWNQQIVSKMHTPVLAVSGAYDKQVAPEHVRDLIADIGSNEKVFADLACSSHNALWEHNHLKLFEASLEWLTKGSVNGTTSGSIKLGY